jgi:hypothetical protein
MMQVKLAMLSRLTNFDNKTKSIKLASLVILSTLCNQVSPSVCMMCHCQYYNFSKVKPAETLTNLNNITNCTKVCVFSHIIKLMCIEGQ